ncbi:hypothetical protein C8Q78DRAFT_1070816 [Trametes maxima]|nr:hypothetical protein C8Q78DRAFT_1070816 [Trametes maxima]
MSWTRPPAKNRSCERAFDGYFAVQQASLFYTTQNEPLFLALNPNGRIPVLVDRNRLKFAIDPQTPHPDEHSEKLQWLFFTHGGTGLMQGQGCALAGREQRTIIFVRFAPGDIPYAKKRCLDETKRLYCVLHMRLAGRDRLAGRGYESYSIANINAFPWVSDHGFCGIDTLDEWPSVKVWVERAKERPAVTAGMQVP